MNSRPSYYHSHSSSFSNNSLAICKEIQRFESVHPSIYAIYDLIELIPDPIVAQQVRDHVVCIEGKYCLLFRMCIHIYLLVSLCWPSWISHSYQHISMIIISMIFKGTWSISFAIRSMSFFCVVLYNLWLCFIICFPT